MRSTPATLGSSLRQPIDVLQSLKACPSDATTTGTFFQHIRDTVKKRTGAVPANLMKGVSTDRWMPFLQYPLRDFMNLAVNAAGILHTHEPLAEGLRRIGWMAYPSFAATMGGRIVLYALGEELEQVIQAAPKIFAVTVPGMEVVVRNQFERHAQLEFRRAYCFPEAYARGMLEGTVWGHGFEPRISVTVVGRPSDVDVVMDW